MAGDKCGACNGSAHSQPLTLIKSTLQTSASLFLGLLHSSDSCNLQFLRPSRLQTRRGSEYTSGSRSDSSKLRISHLKLLQTSDALNLRLFRTSGSSHLRLLQPQACQPQTLPTSDSSKLRFFQPLTLAASNSCKRQTLPNLDSLRLGLSLPLILTNLKLLQTSDSLNPRSSYL